MTKKRIISISIIIVLSLFLIYWFYFSKPTAFPTDKQLKEQMNQIFPGANVETIQDTIKLDEEHVFVPFISGKDTYGTSYWVWEKHKWKPAYIDTTGEPRVWMIDREDPTSFHVFWNMHPDDQISYAKFYLIRPRNYQISYGEHTYVPRIQVEKRVEFEGKSYGSLKLPEDWSGILTQLVLSQDSRFHSTSLLANVGVFIGWSPFDENNEMAFPANSLNGSGYSNVSINMDFVRMVDRFDLE